MRLGLGVACDYRAPGADRRAGRSTTALGIGPGDFGILYVIVTVARLCNRTHRLGFVMFRIADPDKLVTADIHHRLAHISKHSTFVGYPNNDLVARVDHVQRTGGSLPRGLHALPGGQVGNNRGDTLRFALGLAVHRHVHGNPRSVGCQQRCPHARNSALALAHRCCDLRLIVVRKMPQKVTNL